VKYAFLACVLALMLVAFAQNQSSSDNATAGNAGESQTASSPSSSVPANSVEVSPYSVTQRGFNHRVWQRVTARTNHLGETVYRTNSYTELATGMHHWNGSQWVVGGKKDRPPLAPDAESTFNFVI
jgi:hypothetical protein